MEGILQDMKVFIEESTERPLLAWLERFDKNGDGKIDMQEFRAAMEGLRYPGNVEDLFSAVDADNSGYLTMNEIDEWSCDLWAAFRRWCGQTFPCADDMVAKLSQEIGGHLHQGTGRRSSLAAVLALEAHRPSASSRAPCFTEPQFLRNAVRLGWYGSFEPVLFKCLDKEGQGRVTALNLAWLEQEHYWHVKRSKSKTKSGGSRDMAKAARSLQSFSAFLRMKFGFPFRGWRSVLDREASMLVHRRHLLNACNELGWHGDVSALWHALDPDDTGIAPLEMFSAAEARALAIARRWLMDFHGGVKAGFRALLLADRRSRQTKGRLNHDRWLAACDSLHVPFDVHHVFRLLDWEQSGSISYKEVKFLEDWVPPDWLSAAINPQAAEEFKQLLLEKCDHFVKAWRLVIDVDGSGKVNFVEFKRAADTLRFPGDINGAFLAFDVHGQGEITLNEIDQPTAKSLSDFRRWAYAEFGGVMLAFKALDTDGSGVLSWREFKQAFNRYRFKGDVWLLFNSLNVDGDNAIGKSEVAFLDDWEIDMLRNREDFENAQPDSIHRTSPTACARRRAVASVDVVIEKPKVRKGSMSGARLLELVGWCGSGLGGGGQEDGPSAAPSPGLPSPAAASRASASTAAPSPSFPPTVARQAWEATGLREKEQRPSWAAGSRGWAAALGAHRAGRGRCITSYRSSPSARKASSSCSGAHRSSRPFDALVPM